MEIKQTGNSQDTENKDLPYIFQLLESEDEVADSISSLEDDMTKIDNKKKRLNVDFYNQSHLVRNIIFALIFASALALLLHFSFFLGFLIGLIAFFGYDMYKKNVIKSRINNTENQMNEVISKKNDVQNQLSVLVKKNSAYTNRIPEQFRDPGSVLMLFNYLYYGQADTLKEAYQLLDLEYKHQEQMGVLRENADLLKENNQVAYQQLNQLQGLSASQAEQLNSMKELSMTARDMKTTVNQNNSSLRGLEEEFVPKYKRKN